MARLARRILCMICLMTGNVSAEMPDSFAVRLEAEPVSGMGAGTGISAGKPARIRLQISGKYDGSPVSGLHPAAWIRPQLPGAPNCRDAVRNYLSTGANAVRDVDLNSYGFLVLNQDNTVAILDPRLNLASANLLALGKTGGRVADWYLDTGSAALFVLLPERKQLHVLSAIDGGSIAEIDLPDAAENMLAQPGDGMLWLSGGQKLIAVDIQRRRLLRNIPLKPGPVLMAASEERELLWAYAGGELLAVDAVSLQVHWRRELEKGFSSMRYSPQADRLYFGSHERKEIVSLYPGRKTRVETLPLDIQPQALAVSPDGQWLFVMDFGSRQLVLIDTVNNRPVHRLLFRHDFDQLVFSDQYAYLHHTSSANVSLLHLSSLNHKDTPSLLEVPFGVKPPGRQERDLTLIAPLPEGGAVVVLNPADKTLFLYMEDGMLAPANAFKLYTGAPLSLQVHDKTLKETRPGVYETVTLIPRPGQYELVFYHNSPLQVSCLPLSVGGKGEDAEVVYASPVKKIELLPSLWKAGRPVNVRVRLSTASPADGAAVQMLFFKPGGNWQQRLQVNMDAHGEATARVTFPESGKYLLGIRSAQLQLELTQKNMLQIEVTP